MRLLIILLSLIFISGDFLKTEDIPASKGNDIYGNYIYAPGDTLSRQTVSFAFLTDLHVSPGSVSEASLYKIVEEINQGNFDFVVVTGDLSNSGTDIELNTVKLALDKLNKPCYVIPGNHETNWSESAGLTFNKLWGGDHFLFSLKGFEFIGFNTGPFMKMGDGFVKQEDIQWIKQQLQDEDIRDKVLISFSHYPLSDGLDDWSPVVELLKSADCRISLCGHGHHLSMLNFDGIPGIMGRSLLSGNSSPPGYNIVKLRNDSVLVYNKELSAALRKPAIAINYLTPDTLSALSVSPKPDFPVNNLFPDRRVVAEWSDSASVLSGPCLVEDSLLVYGNSMGWLKAINLSSKQIIWRRQISAPVYSTPVESDGILVIGTTNGNITGFNAFTGRKIWNVETGRPVLAEGIIEKGFVYIGGGDRDFYKIDLRSGKVIWKFSDLHGLVQGKPAISGSSVVFGAWDTYLYCLDKNKGYLNWKWNNGKNQKLFSPGNIFPVCSDGKVFIVAPDRYMTAIDLGTGREIWRTARHHVRESLGVSPDGSTVYAKLMNDTVIAVSVKGNLLKTQWITNAGFGYEHNPCPVLATKTDVIICTRDGMLVAIDPVNSKVNWKFKAGISSINKVVKDKHNTFWFTMAEGKIMGIQSIYNQ